MRLYFSFAFLAVVSIYVKGLNFLMLINSKFKHVTSIFAGVTYVDQISFLRVVLHTNYKLFLVLMITSKFEIYTRPY